MKLVAICPVRNEDWILGFSLRVALQWCDLVVVLNHCSTDDSRKILERCAYESDGRVLICDDESPGWPEMTQRQRLLDVARHYDATHIALIDADEVLCSDALGYVRREVEKLPPGRCLNVRMHCMWRGLHQYRTDPGSVWSNRKDLALGFGISPNVEFAAAADGYQHHARAPRRTTPVQDATGIGVMHLQFADWRRLTAKHALYKVRERLQYPERPVAQIESMYNQALNEAGLQVAATPWQWLDKYGNLTKHMKRDAEPWQATEVVRLVKEHGPVPFRGLNLFGIA